MKKLIFCFLFLSLAWGVFAQQEEDAARKATDEAITLYQLNEQQAEEMYQIQKRRFRNLASIEELRQSDYPFFLQKKNSIREGLMASTKRLLTEAQMEIFNQQLAGRRKKEAAVVEEMKQEGATKEEIQIAIWKIE